MEREQIHSKLKSLVQKFEANKYHYLSKNYLEEEVKIDFINPLFEALGWDVRNTKGLSPYEREVVVEKGETIGRPDYNFRIDGQTKLTILKVGPIITFLTSGFVRTTGSLPGCLARIKPSNRPISLFSTCLYNKQLHIKLDFVLKQLHSS